MWHFVLLKVQVLFLLYVVKNEKVKNVCLGRMIPLWRQLSDNRFGDEFNHVMGH